MLYDFLSKNHAMFLSVCLQYEDPEGVLLPPTLSAMGDVSWKRPFDLPTITALSIEVRCTPLLPLCQSLLVGGLCGK